MEQERLFDDRIALLVEEEICFKIVNTDDLFLEDKGGLYSSGKPMGTTKESFEEDVMESYNLKRNQLKWIPFDINKTGRLING